MRFRPKLSVRGVMVLVAAVALMFGIGIMVLSAMVSSARDAAARIMCANQLRKIGLAVRNYRSAHGSFPSATISRAGLPSEKELSWQIAIFHYFDWQSLWDYDPDEPWDSPVNSPDPTFGSGLFACPNSPIKHQKHTPGWTTYVAISGVGPDSPRLPKGHPRAGMFGYDRIIAPADVSDGLSQTMMIVETASDPGPWSAGGPSTLRAVDPKTHPYLGPNRPFGGLHPNGTLLVMADGSVRFVPNSTNPKIFEAMATISGGERVSLPGTLPPVPDFSDSRFLEDDRDSSTGTAP